MVEIDPNETQNYRPFNYDQARQGAPVRLRDEGSSVRILCWDMEHNLTPIVALVRGNKDVAKEMTICYDKDGNVHAPKSYPSPKDLVMAPVGIVDGTPVFWGDKIYHKKTGTVNEINRHWPGMVGSQILHSYAMQPPTIEFKDRPLTIHDELWYKHPNDVYWTKVKMSDRWTRRYTPGVDASHFAAIKEDPNSAHVTGAYFWDFPLEVTLRGKKLELGETIWFIHNPEEKGVVVTERFIELVNAGTIKRSALTRRPWVKKENWQAQVQVDMGDDDKELAEPILLGPIYPSEDQCKEEAPTVIPEGYKFLTAKVVSSYYM